jgi:hypothetical protein
MTHVEVVEVGQVAALAVHLALLQTLLQEFAPPYLLFV